MLTFSGEYGGNVVVFVFTIFSIFFLFPDLCFFMSVGLVAIAAGLRNLLGFSIHVLGSEFSKVFHQYISFEFVVVYHLLVGFFQQ